MWKEFLSESLFPSATQSTRSTQKPLAPLARSSEAHLTMSPVLVLYGSQTGNSREIAKEVCAEALSRGHQSRVLGMERFKEFEFSASEFVVLVVSSTGNGDAPDNADKFYRYCKRKTTPPVFANVPFAVVSLGDSNYEQFCEVGRQFDKHLERLGGARALKRCDVDEVEGIETFVDPWKQKLWDALGPCW